MWASCLEGNTTRLKKYEPAVYCVFLLHGLGFADQFNEHIGCDLLHYSFQGFCFGIGFAIL